MLLAVLSSLVLIVSVGGYVVTTYFDSTIGRVHIDFGGGSPAVDTSNWLLVGTDSRAGSGGRYGNAPGQRSDTTILAHLAKDGTTTLVSIPRDTYVEVPAYTDAKGNHHPAAKDKFTNAINVGGPSLQVATVEQLTGLQLDHYVSVDLAGFRQITDAVGGVSVCVKPSAFSSNDQNDAGTATIHVTNTDDPFSGWHAGPGTVHLNGEQALAFVRQRQGLPEGDINRIQRQQQFLGSVFRSATAPGSLFNPARVTSLLLSVRNALSLDQNTSTSDLEALAERLKGTAASKVVFSTLPVRELRPTDPHVFSQNHLLQLPNVGSVVVYDQKTLDAFLAPLHGQTSAPAPTAAVQQAPVVRLAPAQVRVRVRNGTTRPGLAGQVSRGLTHLRFRSTVAADLTPRVAGTQVRYAAADAQAAQTVAAAVPGSVLHEDNTLPPGAVVLALGEDYDRLQAVRTQGQAPSGSTTAPARSANPAPVTADSASNRCTF